MTTLSFTSPLVSVVTIAQLYFLRLPYSVAAAHVYLFCLMVDWAVVYRNIFKRAVQKQNNKHLQQMLDLVPVL